MKIFFTIATIVLFFAGSLSLPLQMHAQDGSLDLTFDTDGIVTTPIGSSVDKANDIAIQADGKIVVVGYSFNGINTDFAVVRYNTDGSLDTTFDTDGIVTTPVGNDADIAYSVAIQADGKIVAAGSTRNGSDWDISIIRYNTNGSLDISFDTNGIVTTPIGTGIDKANTVLIQSNGKIVVVGYSLMGANEAFAVVRYNTDGSLDLNFDNDGIVTTPVGTSFAFGYSAILQTDEKILVAGAGQNGNDWDFALVRYHTNGSLDLSFDTDGIVITPLGNGDDLANSLVLQADGKIVVGGYSDNGTDDDFALARFHSNGSLDSTFETDGILIMDTGIGNDVGQSVALQSDGKILLGGYMENGTDYDFSLLRFQNNGNIDSTFDTDGLVTTDFGNGNNFAYSLAQQADGKIVLAGDFSNNPLFDFAVVRYNNGTATGINTIGTQAIATHIYPNPCTAETIVQTEQLLRDARLIIYNANGQPVKEINNLHGNTIALSREGLPAGLYFIRLTENNTSLSLDKLIIMD